MSEQKESCRYCDGSGWFYGERDLGPCSCDAGKWNQQAEKHVPQAEPKRGSNWPFPNPPFDKSIF